MEMLVGKLFDLAFMPAMNGESWYLWKRMVIETWLRAIETLTLETNKSLWFGHRETLASHNHAICYSQKGRDWIRSTSLKVNPIEKQFHEIHLEKGSMAKEVLKMLNRFLGRGAWFTMSLAFKEAIWIQEICPQKCFTPSLPCFPSSIFLSGAWVFRSIQILTI